MRNELSISMSDCFDKGLAEYVGEMPEFTLDIFLNDGTFKDFPFFSGRFRGFSPFGKNAFGCWLPANTCQRNG